MWHKQIKTVVELQFLFRSSSAVKKNRWNWGGAIKNIISTICKDLKENLHSTKVLPKNISTVIVNLLNYDLGILNLMEWQEKGFSEKCFLKSVSYKKKLSSTAINVLLKAYY